jgi:hypothetical protein
MTALRRFLIIIASAALVVGVVRFAEAGSLTPNAVPGGTLQSLDNVYAALGGSFSSAAITASATGSAIQLAKCLAAKLTTGGCP